MKMIMVVMTMTMMFLMMVMIIITVDGMTTMMMVPIMMTSMMMVMLLVLLLVESDEEQVSDEDAGSAADRIFEPRLSRSCDEEVECLRDKWQQLMTVAETVYMELIREKRAIYEQELDKQVRVSITVGSKVNIKVGSRSVAQLGQGWYHS